MTGKLPSKPKTMNAADRNADKLSRSAVRRKDERVAVAARRKAEAKRLAPLLAADGGKEGMVTHVVGVRISATRTDQRDMRAMPGSFAWRYGRKSGDLALFHAGSTLERLWETAGVAAAKSPDLEAASIRGGSSGGASLARLNAIDAIGEIARSIGEQSSHRLFHFLGKGQTAREVARLFNVSERIMAIVLHSDLRDLAMHLRYIPRPGEGNTEGKVRSWVAPEAENPQTKAE